MREEDVLTVVPEDAAVVPTSGHQLATLVKSEVEAQLDAAHRWPRSIARFRREVEAMATFTEEIAAQCIYTIPRKDDTGKTKNIIGPSVRLAEICATAWGNLHVARRVIDADDKEVTAQGLAWDVEKNIKWAVEVRRRITDKNGRRYKDDMVTMTGNAAASIAVRNAIFSAIPGAYVREVFEKARKAAVGDARTFSAKRDEVVNRLTKLGLTRERILNAVERSAIDNVTLEDLETLIGLGTAIKNNEISIDDYFPVAAAAPTKGTLDIHQLRPGREANRGHGEDDLEKVHKGAAVPEPPTDLEQQLADSLAVCQSPDFQEIENAAKAAGLSVQDRGGVAEHVMSTMGFAEYGHLTKARKPEVLAWIKAKGKR